MPGLNPEHEMSDRNLTFWKAPYPFQLGIIGATFLGGVFSGPWWLVLPVGATGLLTARLPELRELRLHAGKSGQEAHWRQQLGEITGNCVVAAAIAFCTGEVFAAMAA